MPDLKVFISSTYEDLKPYRERIIEFFKDGLPDIIFKGMEDMPSGDTRPIDECKIKVGQCNVFILIIGKRYGWIPEDIKENQMKVSITELEYNWAKADKSKTVLCFEADRTVILKNDEDFDGIPTPEKAKQLSDFITRVRQIGIVTKFKTEADLVKQINKALWYKFAGTPFEMKLDEEIMYCCNRDDNYREFKSNYKEGELFNLFLAVAEREDLVENFFNRIVIFDYNEKPERLKILPPKPDTIDGNKSFSGHIESIAGVIYEGSKSIKEAIVKYCDQDNRNIYFKTDISSIAVSEIKNSISYLHQLFTAIKQEVESLKLAKFILFIYTNQKNLYQDLHIDECINLKDFKTVKLADLEKWLEENVSRNVSVRDDIIDGYFLDKDIADIYKIDYRMKITERKMRIMIRDYNNKAEKIWDIVNPT